jgi:hypothetical protein
VGQSCNPGMRSGTACEERALSIVRAIALLLSIALAVLRENIFQTTVLRLSIRFGGWEREPSLAQVARVFLLPLFLNSSFCHERYVNPIVYSALCCGTVEGLEISFAWGICG